MVWPVVHGLSAARKTSTYFRLPSAPLPQRPRPTWRQPQYIAHIVHIATAANTHGNDLMSEASCQGSPAGVSPDLYTKKSPRVSL